MKSRQAPTLRAATTGGNSSETAADARARVLFVENDPDDAQLVRDAFDAVPTETTVDVVADGAGALEFLQQRTGGSAPVPDLVLLDIELPEEDGFEVLERIRNDQSLVHIPVLVLASPDATSDVHESYERAANAHLTKPTDSDGFEAMASAIEKFWFERVSLPSVHA